MSDEQFILKAASLSRAAPHQWDEFLRELQDFADRKKSDCINASPEYLLAAQSRARQVLEILEILSSCRKNADKILARGKR